MPTILSEALTHKHLSPALRPDSCLQSEGRFPARTCTQHVLLRGKLQFPRRTISVTCTSLTPELCFRGLNIYLSPICQLPCNICYA